MEFSDILNQLLEMQKEGRQYFPFGIFPSYRYHQVLPYRRPDDNVYFTSWILIVLNEVKPHLDNNNLKLIEKVIENGETGIANYRNRYGGLTYNFYRDDGYFPNGKFLSKHQRFQPTDDIDDTSIAYRAVEHTKEEALKVKSEYIQLSNGKRNRWIKRNPKIYRQFEGYSTWIGTDQLYIDMDICVLSNALCFNAQYDLGIEREDLQSLDFIQQAISTGDYLKKRWSISAWYPFKTVIFYQLGELISVDYYTIRDKVKTKFTQDLMNYHAILQEPLDIMMIEITMIRLGLNKFNSKLDAGVKFPKSQIKRMASNFSFGVIPILHPFNGLLFQKLSSYEAFKLRFSCEAQITTIYLYWKTLRGRLPKN